ncbi:MAG: cupredoxin domain-containing protein [Ilumatobacteraceae bacterium]
MNTRRTSILAAATIATLVLAACGTQRSTDNAAPPTGDGKTVIEVTMTDMAFTPTTVAVRAGETVTLRFRNDGQAIHEAVIGDAAFQQEHADEMATMGTSGTMNHGNHDESTPLVVQPGQTGELTFTALAADGLLIGCHQPGHWESCMKASIDVT